jgi:hypothetical protein
MSAAPHLRLIEPGDCQCGCGEKAPIAKYNDAHKGLVRGRPRKYIAGHVHRLNGPDYIEEDRGYETPCWVWQKTLDNYGYGLLSFGRKMRKGAHIVSWQNANGPVPPGLELDHLCRVRACVNPSHLEPVTRAENIRRGSRAKLTAEQVRELRALVGAGMTHRSAAARFDVHKSTVGHIVTRRSWKDIV